MFYTEIENVVIFSGKLLIAKNAVPFSSVLTVKVKCQGIWYVEALIRILSCGIGIPMGFLAVTY